MAERFIPKSSNGNANGKRKKGWQKPGPGRPPGRRNRMTKKAREEAALTGELPHQFLLRVMRLGPGGKVGDYTLQYEDIVEAARIAAPYYAPRMASLHIKPDQKPPLVIQLDPDKLKDMTAEQLSRMLAGLMAANGQGEQLMLPAANPDEDIVDADLYERTLN